MAGPQDSNDRSPSVTRRARAWLLRYRREVVLGGAAAVLGGLAGIYLYDGGPADAPGPAGRITVAPPSLAPGEVPGRIVIGWTGQDGAPYRASVELRGYRAFLARDRAAAAADGERLDAQARERVHAAVVPVFEEVAARVPAFGAWTFNWWTSWILLGRVVRWMWDEVSRGVIVAMPERVQARLVAQIEQQFDDLVLQPDRVEPALAAPLARSLAVARAELGTLCQIHAESVREFVREAATQVERGAGAGRWTPVAAADGAAALTLACAGDGRRDAELVRAELTKLRARSAVGDPVDEVIVRLARPFATKLISFVVLPAIVAALIGGIALPLLGILPNILSGVIAGILTGALGAALIGFSASASVDWLLTRADELRNRAGFEVQLRRAVGARRDALEAGLVQLHRQLIDDQLRPFIELPAPPATPPGDRRP